MRHRLHYRKLGRTSSERKALLKNMANSLIKYEQIVSTLPKLKELKPYVDKLVTLGKKDTVANRRRAFAILRDDDSVKKIFSVFSERYQDRNGGYSRVLKFNFRKGDNAPMAIIEMVDRDESAKLLDKHDNNNVESNDDDYGV